MTKSGDPIESELEAIDQEETAPTGKSALRYAPIGGAVIALAAFAGITWYAYNTGIREGSEFAAPVLKTDGPSKIAPESPGGENVPHRKKQVYSLVDKTPVSNKIERLAPQPEPPMTPPVASPNLESPPAPPTLMVPPPPSITGKRVASVEPTPAPKPAPAIPSPPVSKRAKTTTVKKETPAKVVKKADIARPAPPKVVEAVKSSPSSAPVIRAPQKPVAKATVAVVTPKPAAKRTAKRTASASSPPPGAYMVQIASLRTAEAAQRAWNINLKRHNSLFRGMTLFVAEKTIPGRGDFFRVQTGPFKTRAAALRKCAQLKQAKVPCLVIRP
ncbi:MAG: SPOR domain-containing protein [Alphaproteobacteria bacterium]|nr:SPOR domain-containing protein [Alphaproteobacteria bacterium]